MGGKCVVSLVKVSILGAGTSPRSPGWYWSSICCLVPAGSDVSRVRSDANR